MMYGLFSYILTHKATKYRQFIEEETKLTEKFSSLPRSHLETVRTDLKMLVGK